MSTDNPVPTTTYSVPAISCEHCVTAITAEVAAVANVESVAVDIETKTVTVVGGTNADIVAAIDEAGYGVATNPGRQPATAEQQIDDGVMRVTKWTFAPGTETGPHRHEFDYVVVPITNGALIIESSEGVTTAPLTIGASYNRGKGVEHNVANDGDETVAFVEIELLDR